MMQIVYFSQKDQFLTEMESLDTTKMFITPSPAKADGLRLRLQAESAGDVITIAKFSANLVDFLWSGQARPEVKRKADLLLIFGILKEKHLPELGFEQFTQAYNLFSDLRSFSLNTDALTSVLEEQPEIIKKAVLLFWKLLEMTGFHDEHSAYREITERLRTHDFQDELDVAYIFWGFQHLNGQQIDLLKALALRYRVIIPFPLELKNKVKRSDWISWLIDSRTEERILQALPKNPTASWIPINSREIALNLKDVLKPYDQIVLGVSKLNSLHLDIVPSQDVLFKIPVEILNQELNEVSASLIKFKGSHEDLLGHCSAQMNSYRTLKHFRAWQLYVESLQSIGELTDSSFEVDHFFIKVLNEVVRLNQPRTSYVPVSSHKMTIDLKDMSSLEELDRRRRVIFCLDERFEDIQNLGQNYAESIQKILTTLGPTKRNELELHYRHWEMTDLLTQGEIIILMNQEILKHSLVWKRLFSKTKLLKIEKNSSTIARPIRDHFKTIPMKKFNGHFSASKIQAYIDCPRNFYFRYVDHVFPDVKIKRDFDPVVSGTVIHEIIETYFKEKMEFSNLPSITNRVMTNWMRKLNLDLPHEVYLQRELLFNHRASNGINFVQELARRSGEKISWIIEKDFQLNNDFTIKGKIDCLGIGQRHLFLLDFKSTEFSANSGSEIIGFEAIQLWAYAHAAATMIDNLDSYSVTLGYVVLDDPAKSIVVSWDDGLLDLIKSDKFCKITKVKRDLPSMLKEARERLISLANEIRDEKDFPAKPRSKDSCIYCELNKICVRSEVADV
jgi:CRISPR/Cas system-associated exonuclease Cas4 (RecB family)